MCILLAACGADPVAAPQVAEPALTQSTSASTSTEDHPAVPLQEGVISLRIPDAQVDDPVTPEGLSQGDIINPAEGSLIWFTGADRVRPGERGTAVIAGHVSYEGRADIFASLVELSPGDVIQTTDVDTRLAWRVSAVELLDKGAVQRDPRVWDDQRRTRRLVLITCDDAHGFRDDGHRKANLIIIAEPITG